MAWSSYAPLMGMSSEPKVHCCYFAGGRRTDVRTCSKPEGEQG
jgi:hypothetical protein